MTDECKCSFAIRLTGDGCRYCQPQTYIDHLEQTIAEMREEEAAIGAGGVESIRAARAQAPAAVEPVAGDFTLAQEMRIIDIAVQVGLGEKLLPILGNGAPVFAVNKVYRTAELMDFSASLLAPYKRALAAACDHIDMDALRISHCKDAAAIGEAMAAPTTKAEPAIQNPWQQAVDHELVVAHLGVAGAATQEEAKKALSSLIQWHIDVATNPAVNGGFELKPSSALPAVEPVDWPKGVAQFTKKPVTISAIQWTGTNLREVIAFTDGPPDTRSHHAGMKWNEYQDLVEHDGLKIYTLEGKMLASIGDWIIRGVKGEYYPCKPDIFAATYAPISAAAPAVKPVSTGKWLTVVYKNVVPGEEAALIGSHPKASALSWSHAMDDRDEALAKLAPAPNALDADMFWNDDDPEKQHSSIEEFLNDEICNGVLNVGDVRTLQRGYRLPNISIRVTAIDDESCDAEYEVIAAQSARSAQGDGPCQTSGS